MVRLAHCGVRQRGRTATRDLAELDSGSAVCGGPIWRDRFLFVVEARRHVSDPCRSPIPGGGFDGGEELLRGGRRGGQRNTSHDGGGSDAVVVTLLCIC